MWLKTAVLFAIVTFAAWHFHLIPTAWHDALMGRVSAGPPMYKWQDEKGRITYGTQPPAGRKAQRVTGGVSVLPATEVPAAPPAQMQTEEDPRTLQQRATDRAIEQSTR